MELTTPTLLAPLGLTKPPGQISRGNLQTNHIWKVTLVADGANPNLSMYIRATSLLLWHIEPGVSLNPIE